MLLKGCPAPAHPAAANHRRGETSLARRREERVEFRAPRGHDWLRRKSRGFQRERKREGPASSSLFTPPWVVPIWYWMHRSGGSICRFYIDVRHPKSRIGPHGCDNRERYSIRNGCRWGLQVVRPDCVPIGARGRE
ncbi:hypothetical protein MRX96_037262 [Rhipicephalus microplus]